MKKLLSIICCVLLLGILVTGCELDSSIGATDAGNSAVTPSGDSTTQSSSAEDSATLPSSPAEDTTPTETTAPVHVHSFADATCTAPKTCSCGATEGSAAGHAWQEATCTAPKTCSNCGTTEGEPAEHSWNAATCNAPKTCSSCGATEGSAAGHQYAAGKCSSCGESDPNYVSSGDMVWIPTNGGKKYHTTEDCSNMKEPTQVTKEEAESQGFTPCKRCH